MQKANFPHLKSIVTQFSKAKVLVVGDLILDEFIWGKVTRISPELHRQVNVAAALSGKSLNAWVSEQLQSAAVLRVGAIKSAANKKITAKTVGRKTKVPRKTDSRKSNKIEQHA